MDGLFEEVKVELVQIVKEAADNIDIVINFLMIAKYFERIGDHAVNICEWVEFLSLIHISLEKIICRGPEPGTTFKL